MGPLESSFIAKHKSNKTGDNTTIPINDKIKSMIRFNPSLYNKTHSICLKHLQISQFH